MNTLVETALILFLATVVRSAFGFGEALVAVPLLTMVIPVDVAAPVAVLASITVALIVVARDWRSIHLRSAGQLVLATLFGIPAGLFVLKTVPDSVAKSILAVIIASFSLYSLARPGLHKLDTDRLAPLFGFFAGVLGGAYGMNGPPLAIYGSLRRWTPENFRATLQGYFLPASAAGMIGYLVAGLWTARVNQLYLVSLPGVVIGVFAGRAINNRLSVRRFVFALHTILLGIAALLLVQAIRG